LTVADRLRGAGVGALAGLLGGLFGVGGGIVLIPILTGRLGLTQHQAHGTSLAVIGATALAGLVVYGAAFHVAWGTALAVGVASVTAAPLGAWLAGRVSPRGLRLAFAAFLVATALRLLWVPPVGDHPPAGPISAQLALDLALGLAIGLLAGFMGVGGGILAVPAFTLLLGMPQSTAQGTSLAVILVTAPAGAVQHHRQRTVVWSWVPMLALGAALAAPLAARVANRLPHAILARAFALFMIITAAHMAITSLRARPAAAPGRG
jgi:uncharacterized membrane protein YfcA